MEAFARRLIREQRERSQLTIKPASIRTVKLSEIFKHYFGPEHGVDLPLEKKYSHKKLEFDEEE